MPKAPRSKPLARLRCSSPLLHRLPSGPPDAAPTRIVCEGAADARALSNKQRCGGSRVSAVGSWNSEDSNPQSEILNLLHGPGAQKSQVVTLLTGPGQMKTSMR